MPKIRMERDTVKADPEGLQFRMMSDCGNYEVGVYPTKTGGRIRAGFTKLPVYQIDWGFGNDEALVAITYHMILGHLEKFDVGENPFVGLPYTSKVEPAYNDMEFMQTVIDKLVTRKIAMDKIQDVS